MKQLDQKLTFSKMNVIELNDADSSTVIGGTEDLPTPTILQQLTKLSITRVV